MAFLLVCMVRYMIWYEALEGLGFMAISWEHLRLAGLLLHWQVVQQNRDVKQNAMMWRQNTFVCDFDSCFKTGHILVKKAEHCDRSCPRYARPLQVSLLWIILSRSSRGSARTRCHFKSDRSWIEVSFTSTYHYSKRYQAGPTGTKGEAPVQEQLDSRL